jgi:hypothetical protein
LSRDEANRTPFDIATGGPIAGKIAQEDGLILRAMVDSSGALSDARDEPSRIGRNFSIRLERRGRL